MFVSCGGSMRSSEGFIVCSSAAYAGTGAGRGASGASGSSVPRGLLGQDGLGASPSAPTCGSHSRAGLQQVPVPVAEQLHRGGQEHAADNGRVEQDGDRQPEPHLLEVEEAQRDEDERSSRPSRSTALVTVPAVDAMPCLTASSVVRPAVVELPDAGEDEHVVVHREPEQDHEQEQRQPVRHPAGGREAEQRLSVAVLEHQHEHAVGSAPPRGG